MYWHSRTLCLPGLAVPLVIELPGRIPEGVRVKDLVRLRDFTAKVMQVTTGEGAAHMQGRSLAQFWQTGSLDADILRVETRQAPGQPEWDATSRGILQGTPAG